MLQVADEILIVLNDIAKLAIRNHPDYKEYDKLDLIDTLEKHFAYGTLDWIYKRNELIAAVRYNILNQGRVADVLDMIIKPGHNSRSIMKYFIARGWARFPSLKYIRFEREFKDNKGHRMYRIDRFFTKEIKNG